MSPTTIIGLALLILGGSLAYLGLYVSDSLFLLQSSALHFLEHMQMLWGQMAQTPRFYLGGGLVVLLIGVILLLLPKRRTTRSNEFY